MQQIAAPVADLYTGAQAQVQVDTGAAANWCGFFGNLCFIPFPLRGDETGTWEAGGGWGAE